MKIIDQQEAVCIMKKLTRLKLILLAGLLIIISIGISGHLPEQNVLAAGRKENNINFTKKFNQLELAKEKEPAVMKIRVKANDKVIVFELNNSSAAKSLYEQLPMTIEVENYSNDEKIFYPDQKLDVSDTPLAQASLGTLAYYAPWGDVVMFYADFGSASGLYELGQAISGQENISSLSGTIKIESFKQWIKSVNF